MRYSITHTNTHSPLFSELSASSTVGSGPGVIGEGSGGTGLCIVPLLPDVGLGTAEGLSPTVEEHDRDWELPEAAGLVGMNTVVHVHTHTKTGDFLEKY